jgi:hypothetical protein
MNGLSVKKVVLASFFEEVFWLSENICPGLNLSKVVINVLAS